KGFFTGIPVIFYIPHVVHVQHCRTHHSDSCSRQQNIPMNFSYEEKITSSHGNQSEENKYHNITQTQVSIWFFSYGVAYRCKNTQNAKTYKNIKFIHKSVAEKGLIQQSDRRSQR